MAEREGQEVRNFRREKEKREKRKKEKGKIKIHGDERIKEKRGLQKSAETVLAKTVEEAMKDKKCQKVKIIFHSFHFFFLFFFFQKEI